MTPDFTKEQIAAACQTGTPLGPLPEGVYGPQLLWAIAGNESSFGFNCTPRYEQAFDFGGPYADAALLNRFGRAAACSYGPWQIMFCNCPQDYMPADMQDLNKATLATVLFLNRQLERYCPSSLSSIAAIWNGGNPSAIARASVANYSANLAKNYLVPIEVA
jgi:hypothetical protein